jgi:hypothetical protein
MTSHESQNQRSHRSQSRKAKSSKESGIAVGDVEIFPDICQPMNKVSLSIQLGGRPLAAVRHSWGKLCISLCSIICLIFFSVLLYEGGKNR